MWGGGRWRRIRGLGVVALRVAPCAALYLALVAGLVAGAGAQQPTRPDSARADTTRADTTRADSAAATSDSTRRDSIVARQLAADTNVRRQTIFDLLQLDRLRLTAVGATGGAAWPTSVESTSLWSVHADYGEIARGVRLLFVVSYWGSRYEEAAVRTYEEAIRDAVIDPAGDDTVRLGKMSVSDISLGVEGRWWPLRDKLHSRTLRPFLGAGVAAHAVNVEGAGLGDSFVEDGLDQITAGVVGSAGLDIAILPNFLLTMLARYDLFSGVRHATARAGFSYVLDAGALR